MMHKIIFYIALLLVLAPACNNAPAATTLAEIKKPNGVEIFEGSCMQCHGRYGNAGLAGASDLIVSTISREEIVQIIITGKGDMAAFEELLSEKEIEAVTDHVLSLRK